MRVCVRVCTTLPEGEDGACVCVSPATSLRLIRLPASLSNCLPVPVFCVRLWVREHTQTVSLSSKHIERTQV